MCCAVVEGRWCVCSVVVEERWYAVLWWWKDGGSFLSVRNG